MSEGAQTIRANAAERDRDYWRQSAAHAEKRSANLALLLARLTDETFDWAFSLCGEREGLDELRTECKAALRQHVEKGGATESPFTTLLEQLEAEDQPWLKTEAELMTEFAAYCAGQDFQGEHDGADALLMRDDLTPEQREWLSDFLQRWEAMEARRQS